jgi:hypothetical protein
MKSRLQKRKMTKSILEGMGQNQRTTFSTPRDMSEMTTNSNKTAIF